MPRIDLVHPHSLAQDQIRQVVDDLAARLQSRYGLEPRWEDGALKLSGPGIQGRVELQPRQVRVVAELGLLLSAMRGIVEQEIRRALAEKLG